MRNNNTTKITENTLTSAFIYQPANAGRPVAYGDTIWDIAKDSTKLKTVLASAGTYSQTEINEAFAKAIVDVEGAVGQGGSVSTQISDAINALDADVSGSSHGVSVRVVETDGKNTSVTVTAPDFANTYDAKGAATTAENNVKAIIGGSYTSGNTVANAISTLSGSTISAISSLSGSTTSAISSLSGSTASAISSLSGSTTSAISSLSGATESAIARISGSTNDINDTVTVLGQNHEADINEINEQFSAITSIDSEEISSLFTGE